MTTLSVPVPGATLHTVDEGSGPPIVLLHAGIADLRAWDAMVPYLTGAGYRVIRYDQRGFGRTVTEDVAFSNRADCHRGARRARDRPGGPRRQLARRPDHLRYRHRVPGSGRRRRSGSGPASAASMAARRRRSSSFRGQATRSRRPTPLDPDAIADFDVRFWVDGPGQPTDRVPADDPRGRSRDGSSRTTCRPWSQGQPIPLDPKAVDRLADLRCPVLAVAGTLDVSECVTTARHPRGERARTPARSSGTTSPT